MTGENYNRLKGLLGSRASLDKVTEYKTVKNAWRKLQQAKMFIRFKSWFIQSHCVHNLTYALTDGHCKCVS